MKYQLQLPGFWSFEAAATCSFSMGAILLTKRLLFFTVFECVLFCASYQITRVKVTGSMTRRNKDYSVHMNPTSQFDPRFDPVLPPHEGKCVGVRIWRYSLSLSPSGISTNLFIQCFVSSVHFTPTATTVLFGFLCQSFCDFSVLQNSSIIILKL